MPLSSAEKQRRYRDRKRAEREARERYDRGLPEPPPEPVAPDGAYLTDTGLAVPKYGFYAAKDGTFPPIPDALLRATLTTAAGEVKPLEDYQQKVAARGREESGRAEATADIYAYWREESVTPDAGSGLDSPN